MDVEAIRDSPIGTLVPISGTDPRTGQAYEHMAFLPAPLPEEIPQLTNATWLVVVEASAALARLDQGGRQIPAPELLRRPAVRREAQSTSALEGTYAAFTDLLEADLEENEEPRSGALRELLNYVRAAEQAFDWICERPLTLTLIGQLQRILVQGTIGDLSDAGGIRDRQVVVGSRGVPVTEARYVPPPSGDALRGGVEAWLEWLSRDSSLPPVLRAALAHYQFEALHPFSDGNGRIGRLLVVLQLMQYRALREPLLIVSPWFEERRRDYQDHLLALSQTGDYDSWVAFFCEGIRAQAVSTLERVEKLLDYQVELRDLVRNRNIRGVAARIAEDLIGTPMIQPTWAAKHYGVSYQAANTGIQRLLEEQVLEEMTGRSYRRIFASRTVLSLLQG
jgi:cell filamentation protein, protein adenylyltransferase